MDHIKLFENFDEDLKEMNGYGEESFFFAKDGDQSNYMFKIEDGDGHRGLVISIGKFSQFTQPTEAKNAYGVISITEMSEAELDQAVIDEGVFDPNEKFVDVDPESLTKILDTLSLAVEAYLQDESKVNKFYDEMPNKIKSELYDDAIKSTVKGWPGEWDFQEIEKGKLNLITK